METTVTKTCKAKYMLELFDVRDKINIRHFQARNYMPEDDDAEVVYTYDLVIRHNEDENPKELLNNALLDLIQY